jgi:Ribosomal protein L35Ae
MGGEDTIVFEDGFRVKSLIFIRTKNTQNSGHALLRIEGVNDSTGLQSYFGKRVAHVYKAATAVNGTKFRVNFFVETNFFTWIIMCVVNGKYYLVL